MSSYIGYFKSNIEVKEPEKGIPIDDLIDTLLRLEKSLNGLPKASEKAAVTSLTSKDKAKTKPPTTKTYFRGANKCCIQIEICYEVEDNDNNVNFLCEEKGCNIADYYLTILRDNFIYNTLPSTAVVSMEKSSSEIIVMESDGKEYSLNKIAVGLKQIKSFDNNVQKLLQT